MHYHIDWSSTGFGSEMFDSYAEAHEAAHRVVEDNRLSQSNGRPLPPWNETFKMNSSMKSARSAPNTRAHGPS
jgi:hypothetical protein